MSDICVPTSNKRVKGMAEKQKVKMLANILGRVTKYYNTFSPSACCRPL